MKPRYARKPRQEGETHAARDPRCCAAYGCPLPGTSCKSLKGGEQWYCRFHDGQDPTQFDAISQRIRKNIGLIEHADKIKRAGPVVWGCNPEKFQSGNALLRRQPGETWRPYLTRLTQLVTAAIYDGHSIQRLTHEDRNPQRADSGPGIEPSGIGGDHGQREASKPYRHIGDLCPQASRPDQQGDHRGAESV